MRIRNLLLASFLFTITVSCKKGEETLERNYIISMIDKYTLSEPVKWVIILPGMGCPVCIQEGEVFMQENIDNKEMLFVLTKIESLKILQQKIGVELRGRSNVHIDTKENYHIPSKNNIYPCIIYLENGEIKSHEFQSPGNNAFANLRNQFLGI